MPILVKEYYNLETSEKCPYYLEHFLYWLYGEHGKQDYGLFRDFRRKRVCQHCGKTIDNVDVCGNCGFRKFQTWHPSLFGIVKIVLAIAAMAFFIMAIYNKG